MSKKKPKKWSEVYAMGTKEGNEESRFFCALARNARYDWRSVGAIARESKLTKERVEHILAKYYKMGLVFQNPANEDQWGYWERVPNMLPSNEKSIAKQDQDSRIDKAMKEEGPTLQNSYRSGNPGPCSIENSLFAKLYPSLIPNESKKPNNSRIVPGPRWTRFVRNK